MQNLIDVDTSDRVPEPATPRKPLGERLREAVEALNERFPQASQWVDRFDVDGPAVMISVAVHVVVLLSLGMFGYAVHRESERRFEASTSVDTTVSDLERSIFRTSTRRPRPRR